VALATQVDFGRGQVAHLAQHVVQLVGAAGAAAVGQQLQLELQVGERPGVEQLAQLLGAEEQPPPPRGGGQQQQRHPAGRRQGAGEQEPWGRLPGVAVHPPQQVRADEQRRQRRGRDPQPDAHRRTSSPSARPCCRKYSRAVSTSRRIWVTISIDETNTRSSRTRP